MATGNDVDALARSLLQDAGALHWTAADFLLWLKAGLRDVAANKPKATTDRMDITLTANVTKQVNPNGVLAVLDLTANMGSDGATPGRYISTTTADLLGAARPGWRADKGDVVKHLVQDERDPTGFYVWPAPKTALHVEGLVQKHPSIAALTDTLPVDDSYINALAEFCMHMAYAAEGDQQNEGLSAAHYAKYAQMLGIQIQKQKKASAPANSAENPAYPAVDKNGA